MIVGVVAVVRAREGVGAVPLEAFDAATFDASRPHRGVITSATTLRLLLDGSRTEPKAESAAATEALAHAPQQHGPACDSAAAAMKALEVRVM